MGEESCFPRGGSAPQGVKRKAQLEPDLFMSDTPNTSQVKKKPKLGSRAEKQARLVKRQKRLKAEKSCDNATGNSRFCSNLTYRMLTPDMLLLGCVKWIADYHLDVCLSNGLVGRVSIAHVSHAYTQLLQQLTEGSTDEGQEHLGQLSELFCVSRVVRCRMISCDLNQKGSERFSISVDPRHVNSNLSAATLHPGLVLTGTVESREDHGYIVDLGVANTPAFLKTKDADMYVTQCNLGRPLKVGSYLTCRIQKVNKSSSERCTVIVSVDADIVNKSMVTSEMNITMHSLLPGMVVEVTITKVTKSGLHVSFLSYNGCITSSHLMKSTTSYTLQDTLQAAILYIQPQTKEVSLTTLKHLLHPATTHHKQFGDVTRGQVYPDATVCQIESKRGVTFKLKTSPKVKAFATMNQLEEGKSDDRLSKFTMKSTHKCRVVNFDYVDNVVIVTLKKSLVEEKYLSYGDMKAGMIVTGTVSEVRGQSVYIRLSKFVWGLIPHIHLTDSPQTDPQRRYALGNEVTAKVLSVNASSRRIILTAKKSLIRSKFTDVCHYEEVVEGSTIQGFITNVRDTGVIVKFYNNVKGWVHRTELSFETIDVPQSVFYKGQVVKCHVLKCVPEEEKLSLSFKKEGLTRFGMKTFHLPDSFQLGKLVDCTITSRTNDGFHLQIEPSHLSAYISRCHLSDFTDIADLLWKCCAPGDRIAQAMVIGSSSVIVLTKKKCLIQAMKDGRLLSELSDLKQGMLLPVVVTSVAKFGVFVTHVDGISGLVPVKYFSQGRDLHPSSLYTVGQSCMARVHDVGERLTFSFRTEDDEDDDDGVGLLEEYLAEREMALKTRGASESEISTFTPGHLVTVNITDMDDDGVCCDVHLTTPVKGFATHTHMGRLKCSVGNAVPAVVLHSDVNNGCLQLSLDTGLKKMVSHRKQNAHSKVQLCQQIKCHVQLIKPYYILVSLRGHASGSFAYLPVRKNLNERLDNNLLMIGQDYYVTIASLNCNVIIAKPVNRDKMKKTKKTKKLGAIVLARTAEITDDQMNVTVGHQRDSVRKSQVLDHEVQDQVADVSKKRKKQTSESEADGNGDDFISLKEKKSRKVDEKLPTEESVLSREVPPSPSSELEEQRVKQRDTNSIHESPTATTLSGVQIHRLEVDVPFAWDNQFKLPTPSGRNESSEDEDDKSTIVTKVKVKLTRQQKTEQDKKLYKTETDLMDSERMPISSSDFDRLALESPDSSLVWLRYITFHLELAEVDKARAIAERALKTISFREEQEKLNVWMAYLNLENLYGTADSLSAVLQRALQANEPASVYRQLIAIYMSSGKIQSAEQIHSTMVRRFSADSNVWCEFGQFYYKTQRPESARKLMNRALLSLPQNNHVNLLGKFAQMEMKIGDVERGRTMFEKVLSSYPKRTDLWSVYIDLQIKLGDQEPVRKLFDRAIQLPLSALKMRAFFKKYLEFEQRHGTPEHVDDVKRKAVAYADAKTNSA